MTTQQSILRFLVVLALSLGAFASTVFAGVSTQAAMVISHPVVRDSPAQPSPSTAPGNATFVVTPDSDSSVINKVAVSEPIPPLVWLVLVPSWLAVPAYALHRWLKVRRAKLQTGRRTAA